MPDNHDLTHKVAETVFIITVWSMTLNADQITAQIKLAHVDSEFSCAQRQCETMIVNGMVL